MNRTVLRFCLLTVNRLARTEILKTFCGLLHFGKPMKTKILIVDDNRLMTKIYKHLLEDQHGFSVEIAMNHTDLVSSLPVYQPDIVLLDLHLPERSGAELLDLLEQDGCGRQVKIILHSGDHHKLNNFGSRVHACLPKPADLDQLVHLVTQLSSPALV